MDSCHRARRIGFGFGLFFALTVLLLGAGQARASAAFYEMTTLTSAETLVTSSETPTSTPSIPASISETPSPSPTTTDFASQTPTSSLTPIFSDTPASPPATAVSLLVGLKKSTDLDAFREQTGFSLLDVGLSSLNVYRVDILAGKIEEVVQELAAFPEVAYVEPDGTVTAQDTLPNDPGFAFQYALLNIRAPQGWDMTTGSHLVTIAIVDSGVDQTHPELAPKILPGYDFVNGDADPQDDNGHGTHVAGIAAAFSNNGLGMTGVSWGAQILPVKVLNEFNSGTYSNVAAGIIWATDQGAQVINLSLGGGSPSLTLENAVNYAAAHGVALVAAAGNTGGAILYPARYPNVIAVASTNAANLRAPSSAFGPELDLSAPGVSIYSLAIGGGYTTLGGTSMAAPHVSGALALLLSMPGVGPIQARSYLETSALDLDAPGWDIFTGYGLIQLDAALALAVPTATPTASATSTSNLSSAPGRNLTLTPGIMPVDSLPFTPVRTASPIALFSNSPTIFVTFTGTSPAAFSMLTPTLTFTPSSSQFIAKSGRIPWMPCLGVFLILLGFLLAALARRRWQKSTI